jgi:threonine/homoserine/homoserine lactone efflux protein
MTLGSIFALFTAMLILAALPSISVLAVTTQSASSGWIYGAFTAIGIVLGDILFILVAIGGLSFLMKMMGGLFVLIKLLGAVYVIWMGIGLCRSIPQDLGARAKMVTPSSKWSSFMTGLLITLGDQKATLFYLGFFPAFLDISKMSTLDLLMIIAIAVVTVGGVKLGYAFMADKARFLMNRKLRRRMNGIAGSTMILVGLFLILQAAGVMG